MVQSFTIPVSYGGTMLHLRCVLEYHSEQIMQLRVYGSKSSILLENNFPVLRASKSRKGIVWKIKEGTVSVTKEKHARLLMDIFRELENWLAQKFPVL